ncbi:MAG: PAS domain S-box protein [FCB group bacterium]|nr:PAS domain S-box protein [FCB group bacterium]
MENKILIINESDEYRDRVSAHLKKAGYEVLHASNGKAGLDVFRDHRPAVVILDIAVSVMNGLEFLRRVEIKPGSSFSVIILTDFENDENVRFCYNLGARSFLNKDHKPEELLTMVHFATTMTDYQNQVTLAQFEVKKKEADLQAMKESYRRVNMILENRHFFYEYEKDKLIKNVSGSIKSILGYTPDEFTLHHREYLSKNPINDHFSTQQTKSLSGISNEFELEFLHKSGEPRKLTLTEVPKKDADGKVILVEGIATDITEKEKIQRELLGLHRELEEISDKHQLERKQLIIRQENIEDSVSTWIFEIDKKFQVTTSNQAVEGILGFTGNEIIGQDFKKLLASADKKILTAELGMLKEGAGDVDLELAVKGKDGEFVDLAVKVMTIPEEHTSASLFRLFGSDISSERKLRNLEVRHSALVSVTGETIFAVSSEGIITELYTNGSILLAEKGKTATGKSLYKLPIFKKSQQVFAEYLQKAGDSGAVQTFELEPTQNETPIALSVRISAYGKDQFIIAVRDRTDILQARNTQSELIQQAQAILDSTLAEQQYLLDSNAAVLMANDYAVNLAGKTPQDIKGVSVYEGLPKELASVVRKLIKSVIETGKPVERDKSIMETDYRLSIYPHIEAASGVKSIVLRIKDITDIRKMKAQLDWECSIRSATMDGVADGVFVVDPIGRIRIVSRTFEKLTGFTEPDLLGLEPPYPFWSKGSRKEVLSIFKSCVFGAEGKDQEYTFEFVTQNGETFEAVNTFKRIIDSSGKYLGTVCIISDLAEKKQFHERISELNRKIRFLTDASNDIIFEMTRTGKLIYLSPAFTRLTGYEPDSLINTPLMNLVSRTKRKSNLKLITDLFLHKKIEPFETCLIHKDGTEIPVVINASLVKKDGESHAYGVIKDNRALAEAKAGLKQLVRLFDDLAQTVKDGICRLDIEGSITFANEHLGKLLGYKSADLLGRPLSDFVKDATKLPAGQFINSKKDSPNQYDLEWVRKDGSHITTEVTAIPITSKAGKLAGSLALITDTSVNQAFENALIDSDKKYRSLVDSSPNAIFLMEGNQFIDCNPAALELFGAGKDQLLGKAPFDFSPPSQPDNQESKEKLLQKIEYAYGGSPQIFEWHFLQKDGTPFVGEITLSRIELSGKYFLHAVVNDITDRKTIEEKLRVFSEKMDQLVSEKTSDLSKTCEQLKQERDLFVRGPIMVIRWEKVSDEPARPAYVSQNIQQIGLDSSELVKGSTDYWDQIFEEDSERVREFIHDKLNTEARQWELEYRVVQKKAKPIWVYEFTKAHPANRGAVRKVFYSYLLDISSMKHKESAEKEKQADLMQHGKLNYLGEMGTGIAHELNQPLAIIRAQADVLKLMATYGFDDPSQLERDINEIIVQTERASKIIDNMRGFASGSNQEIEEIDVSEPVEKACQFFVEKFRDQEIELRKKFQAGLPKVFLDSRRFEQIVVNLLSNAQYAVNKKAEQKGLDYRKYIDLISSLDRKAKAVVFTVRDNGTGMTSEEKERCLEPFFTGKKVGDGTGLGLSVVHSIVQEFDGSITIESTPGQGTSLNILIPVK